MARSSAAPRAPSPLWLWAVLLVGIFCRPTAGEGDANREVVLVAEQGAAGNAASLQQGDEKCWIFTHMPKSGGSTIKAILNARWGRENVFLYNSDAWKLGEEHAATFAQYPMDRQVAVGGYSEVLRRHGGQGCKWFTMFRHPIDRVVSAYYYCHNKPQDQACASSAMVASEVDLLSFARMWGNFAVRQFSLGELDIDTVMRVATSPEEREWPAWYMVKEHLMKTDAARQDINAVGADAALHGKVGFTQDLLRDEYVAVGILEEFNATMTLFDRVLGMPKLGWGKYFDLKGVANKNKDFASVKDKALEAAHGDERIKYFLRLDIELYDYAVRLFHEQLARAGLSP